MASLQSLLSPQVLTKVVSQQAAVSSWLLQMFGCQPGGANEENLGHGRNGSYHIYDNVRHAGQGRAPATAAGRSDPQIIGSVPFTYPRMHDSVTLSAEVLHNLGRIDDPAQRDIAGAEMLRRQTETLAQSSANWRKAMLAGVLQDSLYMIPEGESYWFDFAPGDVPSIKIQTQMPDGNKDQLNMLGTGNIIDASWATTTTDIPNQLGQINAAFQQLCGGHLAAIICPWNVWNAVIRNDVVGATQGIATSPFTTLTRDSVDPEIGNTMLNVFRATLNVLPDTVWYITDEGLDLGVSGNRSFKKIVPDNTAVFVGKSPTNVGLSMMLGSEPIAEYDGAAESVKTGLNSWSVKNSNPTTTTLFSLDNALVVNHVPQGIAYGTCIF